MGWPVGEVVGRLDGVIAGLREGTVEEVIGGEEEGADVGFPVG